MVGSDLERRSGVISVGGSVPIWVAFWAGLLSFVSPCTLPLFPSYLGYISGVSYQRVSDMEEGLDWSLRAKAFSHAVFFCLGLSVMFVLLGFGATAIGQLLIVGKTYVRVVGGVLIVVMGLFMAGVVKSQWLLRERRFHLPTVKPMGYFGSLVVGVVFAAGWTPCIGPILASVLTLTATNPSKGIWYMVMYAAGFALPFLVLAVTLTSIRPLLRYTATISRVGGWLMVVMGVLLVTNRIDVLAIWLQRYTGYTGP